jgi:hypothetical protein
MSITTEPKLQLPRKNGILPTPQQPSASRKQVSTTAPKDSVHFGAKGTQSTQTGEHDGFEEQPKLSVTQRILNAPVIKNIRAGIKGAYKGAFDGRWGLDLGLSIGTFIMTLPFALLIPGSHFLIIPGVIAARRSLNAAKGLITGIANPDKILNPEKEPEEV